MEKAAQTAGKAAPAVVAVGAIAAAAPQIDGSATAATTASAQHVVRARLDAAVIPSQTAHPATGAHATTTAHTTTTARRAAQARRAATAGRSYTVRSGDTLSGIAQRYYGVANDWHGLYAANDPEISDPSMIYPGQVLHLPRHLPAGTTASTHSATGYQPRHAAPAANSGDSDNAGGSSRSPSTNHPAVTQVASTGSTSLSGTLGCTGLERLWEQAGGSPAAAVTAASIAMAESGGNQYATGTIGERGYWQINPVNGSLSTYDAYGNAHAAVVMSGNGTNWSPWTTYTSGAYLGRC